MTTERQKRAAKRNIVKAQRAWKAMSPQAHARAQPEERSRAKPGAVGGGEYFHVEVRSPRQFRTFRAQNLGRRGTILRVAGKRASGSWDTQKWLISKSVAHRVGRRLVGDTAGARQVIEKLGSAPVHFVGDRFKAKPRRNIPQSEKPTPAMRRAQRANILKAQAARRKR
jgi:hypothetical protein